MRTVAEVAKMIDHSLLRPQLTTTDVEVGCALAARYRVASVCVRPSDVLLAAMLLRGTGVRVGTVVGFPHGGNATPVKVAETRLAIEQGATEIDMVLNIGRLRSADLAFVEDDIHAVVTAAGSGLSTSCSPWPTSESPGSVPPRRPRFSTTWITGCGTAFRTAGAWTGARRTWCGATGCPYERAFLILLFRYAAGDGQAPKGERAMERVRGSTAVGPTAGLAVGLAVGTVLALLAGCDAGAPKGTASTGASGPSGPSASAPAPKRVTQVWADKDLHPIGQPTAVGGVAVGLVSAPERTLLLVGIDPATGSKLWQQPATPSQVTIGVPVAFQKIGDDRVAYFRPTTATGYAAELVVADARTGADVVKTPALLFNSEIRLCGDGKDVCTSAMTSSRSPARKQYRLEVASGKLLTEGAGVPMTARGIDDSGLLDLGDRPGDTLGLLRDGKLQWRRPAREAFPAGFSSDHGWYWHHFAAEQVYAGSLYGPTTTNKDGTSTIDWGKTSATAGLSDSTGEVLWRDSGSMYDCNETLYTGDAPVRCRITGTSTFRSDHTHTSQIQQVVVEGFDPKTGKATWSVPMSPTEELLGPNQPPVAGATRRVLTGPGGRVALDFSTGKAEPAPADAIFWCLSEQRYDFVPSWSSAGKTRYDRPGGQVAAVCGADGKPATGPGTAPSTGPSTGPGTAPSTGPGTALPGVDATVGVGARVGANVVIAAKDGYLGFSVS